jgi:hypothetical protein
MLKSIPVVNQRLQLTPKADLILTASVYVPASVPTVNTRLQLSKRPFKGTVDDIIDKMYPNRKKGC